MTLAVSIVLFFLGARSLAKYRKGEGISRRTFLWYFPVAAFLLLAEIAFLATGGFTFAPDFQIYFPIELVLAFCGLAFMGEVWCAVYLPKDGWALRCVLIIWILLAGAWSDAMFYAKHKRSSEEAQFQQNLERCAVLLEQGKREELSGQLSGVTGSSLPDLNKNFKDALCKIEVKP